MTNIFDLLSGTWHLQRDIPTQATMQGSARFEPQDADTLAYHESGTLRLASGTQHQAQQRYVYTRSPEGFSVWFAEKPLRLFHAVVLTLQPGGSLTGEAAHLCSADQYDSRYIFWPDAERFSIEHVVRGPKKAYTSVTTFSR
jgi:hypothetical protein